MGHWLLLWVALYLTHDLLQPGRLQLVERQQGDFLVNRGVKPVAYILIQPLCLFFEYLDLYREITILRVELEMVCLRNLLTTGSRFDLSRCGASTS